MPEIGDEVVYCFDDGLGLKLCEPCLDDLAFELAQKLELEVEEVFRCSKTIRLYDPDDEEACYEYEFKVLPVGEEQ